MSRKRQGAVSRVSGDERLCLAVAMKPQDVISEVKESGIRGRGGRSSAVAHARRRGVVWHVCPALPGADRVFGQGLDHRVGHAAAERFAHAGPHARPRHLLRANRQGCF